MTDPSTAECFELEAALRDAATRAAGSEMPLLLALSFFKVVIGLARCLRQARMRAGLPRELPSDLVSLLGAARTAANARLADPALTDVRALRLLRAIEGLARAISLACPAPAKARKRSSKPVQRPAAPPPSRATSGRRSDPFAGVGAIGLGVLDAAAWRDAVIGQAVRSTMGGRPAA